MTAQVHRARFDDLDVQTFHDLVRLRVDVFVVEQRAAYAELDGRDPEPGTEHWWTADDAGPTAYLRVLAEPGFLAGDYDTATLEALPPEPASEAEDLAALVRGLGDLQRRPQGTTGPASGRFWRPAWT